MKKRLMQLIKCYFGSHEWQFIGTQSFQVGEGFPEMTSFYYCPYCRLHKNFYHDREGGVLEGVPFKV